MSTFSAELRAAAAEIWAAQHRHPFVRGTRGRHAGPGGVPVLGSPGLPPPDRVLPPAGVGCRAGSRPGHDGPVRGARTPDAARRDGSATHVLRRARHPRSQYLDPPKNAVVLSIDEKTAIAARSRKHPIIGARPGRPARQEFEYVRHGTASLVAALDVHSGEVLGRIIERNDSATFTSFLTEIDQAIRPGLDIHLVLDNGSSHVSKATKRWLAAHPRFKVRYTPKHASWLNQIELFFSILTRRLLRRGEFTSRQNLADRILHFIEVHDRTAKPFRWTYDGSPLKAA